MDQKTEVRGKSAEDKREKVIFFGNGPLSEYALAVIEQECQVIFHARRKEDLEEVCRLKRENPEAHGVLASFGVLIKPEVLDLFEPEGILNIHPSLLPKYRGASPIESAILAGDDEFGISVMKLAKRMDAGPIYMQATLSECPIEKDLLYRELAKVGARMVLMVIKTDREADPGTLSETEKRWLEKVLHPTQQDEAQATYCGKLDKSMSQLTPEKDTAKQTLRKIVAYQGYPKPKYAFWGVSCIILDAHILKQGEEALLTIPCADGALVAVERLQPEGRKAMDAKAFLNGYKR